MLPSRLTCVQRLPINKTECWKFFSDPRNLATITPPGLGFQMLDPDFDRIRPGMLLTYTVRPLLGLRMSWVTEIKHVVDNELFVDEQRFGPYRLWHHQHLFFDIPGGVEMHDIVNYLLPLGWLGRLVAGRLVRRKLNAIFDYRRQVLERMFGTL